ncbi:cupin domain-containing protein [Deinococcus ruber]|uniref:Cupin type-2 domain-containing protein n=1 Tax=Deinococcus ruber TaxID=1848197 RepID=A0A918FCN2_9DEIO|nr:cupin domain-containing protein [Deinococcus ruber]GGR31004.1 hypothetical protein GCM10008957_47190 [Deinococcus ruber]
MTATTLRTRLIRHYEGNPVTLPGQELLFKLGRHDTADGFVLGLATTQPGHGTPHHVHHREDELFLVVEGELECFAGGQWITAQAGDAVFLPAEESHAFRNAGTVVARHWVLTTPAGFEDFYRAFAAVVNRGGTPDPAALQTTARQYGLDLLPPPVPSPHSENQP